MTATKEKAETLQVFRAKCKNALVEFDLTIPAKDQKAAMQVLQNSVLAGLEISKVAAVDHGN